MGMRTWAVGTIVGAGSLAGVGAADAAVIAYDGFDYTSPAPPADLNGKAGGFGFGGAWTNRQGTVDYVAGSLTPPAPDLATTGNRTQNAVGERIGRALDTTAGTGAFAAYLNGSGNVGADGTTLYVSFLQQVSATGQGFYAVEFHRDGTADANRVIQIGRESNATGAEYGVRVNNSNATNAAMGAEDTGVHLIVARIDFKAGNDDIRIYRDPASLTTEPGTATAQVLGGADLSFDEISIGSFSGTKTVWHDEVRFGDTFASVLPTPEPGAVGCLVGGAVLGLARRRRRQSR